MRNLSICRPNPGSLRQSLRRMIGCQIMVASLLNVCHGQSSAQQGVSIVGSGGTVAAPLYNQWAEEYNKRNPKIQVHYVTNSSSESIKAMSTGSGDFGGGEIPLTPKERAEFKLVEVPGMLIGIVPIYNLPGLQGELRLSGEILAEIFLGRVTTWNSPSIAKLNPKLSLPGIPIKVVHRTPGKGSSYIFTHFLSQTSDKFRTEIGTNPSPAWPVGTSAERSSNMAETVQNEPGSIGYVEAEYAVRLHIPYAAVLNRAGNFVKASPQTMTAACEAMESPTWDRLAIPLSDAPGPDSFPITAFSWFYLPTAPADSARAAATADFLNWAFTDGQRVSSELAYPAFPPRLLEKIREKVRSLQK